MVYRRRGGHKCIINESNSVLTLPLPSMPLQDAAAGALLALLTVLRPSADVQSHPLLNQAEALASQCPEQSECLLKLHVCEQATSDLSAAQKAGAGEAAEEQEGTASAEAMRLIITLSAPRLIIGQTAGSLTLFAVLSALMFWLTNRFMTRSAPPVSTASSSSSASAAAIAAATASQAAATAAATPIPDPNPNPGATSTSSCTRAFPTPPQRILLMRPATPSPGVASPGVASPQGVAARHMSVAQLATSTCSPAASTPTHGSSGGLAMGTGSMGTGAGCMDTGRAEATPDPDPDPDLGLNPHPSRHPSPDANPNANLTPLAGTRYSTPFSRVESSQVRSRQVKPLSPLDTSLRNRSR